MVQTPPILKGAERAGLSAPVRSAEGNPEERLGAVSGEIARSRRAQASLPRASIFWKSPAAGREAACFADAGPESREALPDWTDALPALEPREAASLANSTTEANPMVPPASRNGMVWRTLFSPGNEITEVNGVPVPVFLIMVSLPLQNPVERPASVGGLPEAGRPPPATGRDRF
ncbi:MAG: hypothetical protein JWM59_4578 [Verrucomicrobiales bacterium]|nr:hypothetical protein [Verrucomicrobiales bacterium]